MSSSLENLIPSISLTRNSCIRRVMLLNPTKIGWKSLGMILSEKWSLK